METKQRGSRREKKAVEAFVSLQATNNAVMSRMFKQKAFGDLTPSQFGVLSALLEHGSLKQTSLCGEIAKSSGNMVLVIDNLEKRGLVKREAYDKDRRVKMIVLTDDGRKAISNLLDSHNQAAALAMAPLTDVQLAELTRLTALLGGSSECEPA